MDKEITRRIREWLSPEYDVLTRKEIQDLVDRNDEKELNDRFYTDLEFGTAGLRGTLGAGSNRMNIYNVRKATQGLANYINARGGKKKGVLIGRDSRIMSLEFAREAAAVMVANGIKVYYYDDIHPTPTVSFGVRFLKAIAGIMITASHNPKEYNGYKVIWEDGAQITPPHDDGIIAEVRKIDLLKKVKTSDFNEITKSGLFELVDSIVDGPYLDKIYGLTLNPGAPSSANLSISYTPLYGTGYKLVPASLKKFGFKDIRIVEEQATPDGNFPTAAFPNPEEKEAMKVGMEFAMKNSTDILLASDPDADRLGVMLRKDNGDYALLNGNQIASLFTYYIASQMKETGKMPAKPAMVTTIVTTPLLSDIAVHFGIEIEEVLTGFKWIGMKMREYESSGVNFLFGCEESHGYVAGNFVRDKDAVIASSLFAELSAYYKTKGRSSYSVLMDIYREFGYFRDTQLSVTMKGMEGAGEIVKLMDRLRKDPPSAIYGLNTLSVSDLKNGEFFDLKTGAREKRIGLPSSNVLIFRMFGKTRIIARPSGTEPKIKFYFSSYGSVPAGADLDEEMKLIDEDHEKLKKEFVKVLGL